MNPHQHAFRPDIAARGAAGFDARQARIDERRAFVATKLVFMDACADLTGSSAALITRQVRDARAPGDLWALLPSVLASLPHGSACTVAHAEALARHLESIAPEHDIDTSHAPL